MSPERLDGDIVDVTPEMLAGDPFAQRTPGIDSVDAVLSITGASAGLLQTGQSAPGLIRTPHLLQALSEIGVLPAPLAGDAFVQRTPDIDGIDPVLPTVGAAAGIAQTGQLAPGRIRAPQLLQALPEPGVLPAPLAGDAFVQRIPDIAGAAPLS